MFRFSVLFAVVWGVLGVSARAEEIEIQPTVQVTASRVMETVDAALVDVSVITREEIDASVSRDVLDLLLLEAGIDLYRTGGAGQQTSLFLRGANSNQVLVLIDGVRAAAATTGAYAFEHLPLDAVERIEIVRGPRASYWGSDAIGGVIQIFTRKLEGPRVAFGYGSHDDAVGSAGIGHWNGSNGYSVQVGSRHIGGFSASNAGLCNGPDDPYCSFNPDDDAFRETDLSARGAYALGSQLLSATLLRSEGQVQFDQGYSNATEQVAGVNLEGELGPNWSHRLAFGSAREDLSTPVYSTLNQTRRDSLLWLNEFRVGEGQRLVAGLDFVNERGETRDTSLGLPRYDSRRNTRAIFGGWRAAIDAFDSEVSLRRDDNSEFGGATTGSLAVGWRFSGHARVYASAGQGFRSPSMNELFDPGYGGFFAGNPDLDPEWSRSGELGLEVTPVDNQRLKANLYSTRVRDLISFTGPDNQAENIARASLDGAELSYEIDSDAWSASATYTWQDPRNEDTDTLLLRRARQKATAMVERRFGERFSVGAELVYAGQRDDFGTSGVIALPAYAIVNLRGRYEVSRDWTLSARLQNLGDRNYELVHGYNTAGRSGFVEVTWQPSH